MTRKADNEWYEREKAAFIAWWESEGQKKFSETPTIAAGAGWFARAEVASSPSDAELAIPDIPSIIRCSTWRTPELRESAARLVANILRPDDAESPPQPPDHFPVA
jgi:hypothetical protein